MLEVGGARSLAIALAPCPPTCSLDTFVSLPGKEIAFIPSDDLLPPSALEAPLPDSRAEAKAGILADGIAASFIRSPSSK